MRTQVLQYLDIFYSGEHLERLFDLFLPQLHFKGPWFEFFSASDYIASLQKSPPQNMSYQLQSLLVSENEVATFYDLVKGEQRVPMAQLFQFKGLKIKDIFLIFDTKALT